MFGELNSAIASSAEFLIDCATRPALPGADNGTDFRVFFTAVPIGCLVIAYAIGRWLGKGLAAQHALHGLLTGLAAFAIYLAVCSIPPNTIAMVIAGYGAPLFWSVNVLRLVGCVAGAVSVRRRS